MMANPNHPRPDLGLFAWTPRLVSDATTLNQMVLRCDPSYGGWPWLEAVLAIIGRCMRAERLVDGICAAAQGEIQKDRMEIWSACVRNQQQRHPV